MAKVKPYWCWHYHHGVLVELVTESIADRIAFNRTHKPESELETRERVIHKVKGKLPARFVAAWGKADAAWDKAYAAWGKADAAWGKADAAWGKAYADHMPAILKLHAKECPNCPWDGTTIFPAKK